MSGLLAFFAGLVSNPHTAKRVPRLFELRDQQLVNDLLTSQCVCSLWAGGGVAARSALCQQYGFIFGIGSNTLASNSMSITVSTSLSLTHTHTLCHFHVAFERFEVDVFLRDGPIVRRVELHQP